MLLVQGLTQRQLALAGITGAADQGLLLRECLQQLPGATVDLLAQLLQRQATSPGPTQQGEQRQISQGQRQRQTRFNKDQPQHHHRRRHQRRYQRRQQVRRDAHAVEHRPAHQIFQLALPRQWQTRQLLHQLRDQAGRQPGSRQITTALGNVAD